MMAEKMELNLLIGEKPMNSSQITCKFLDENGSLKRDDRYHTYLNGMDSYEFVDRDLVEKYKASGLCKSQEELKALGSDVAKHFASEEKAFAALLKHDKGGGILHTKSSFSKNSGEGWGRIYPENNISIRSLRGAVRNLMTYKNMVEIDIVNCHPTILYQVATTMKVQVLFLEKYVQCRSKCREEVMNTYDVTLEQAKLLFVRLLFGGTFHNWYMEEKLGQPKGSQNQSLPDNVKPTKFIKGFQNDVKELARTVSRKNQSLCNAIRDSKTPVDEIPRFTRVLSYFLQDIELRIISVACETLRSYGFIRNVWFPLHDGVFVPQYRLGYPNNHGYPEKVNALKATLRNAVHDKLGIFVRWEIKGVELGEKERSILRAIFPSDTAADLYFKERREKLAICFSRLDDNAKPQSEDNEPLSLDNMVECLGNHVPSSLQKMIKKDVGESFKVLCSEQLSPTRTKVSFEGVCLFTNTLHTQEGTFENVEEDIWTLKAYTCCICCKDMQEDGDASKELLINNENTTFHEILVKLPLFGNLIGSNEDVSYVTKILGNMVRVHQVCCKDTHLICEEPIWSNKRIRLELKHRGQTVLDQTFLEGPSKVEPKFRKDNLEELTKMVFGKHDSILSRASPRILETSDENVRFDSKFLEAWERSEDDVKLTYFLKGSTGCGKTKAIKRDVLPLMNENTTMLQPCPRVTLGKNTQLRYNKGYEQRPLEQENNASKRRKTSSLGNYQSDGLFVQDWDVGFYQDDMEHNKLIIQVDSLYKLDRCRQYDVVIIDECASVFRQFLSEQIVTTNTIDGLEKLVHAIKTCRVLIIMDADLSEFEVDAIMGWRGPESIEHLVYGTHAVATFAAKKFRIVSKETLVQEYVRDLILQGKRIIFPSSSKKELKKLVQEVLWFVEGKGKTPRSQNLALQCFATYWGCDDKAAIDRLLSILNGIVTLHGDSEQAMKSHFIEQGNFTAWTPSWIYHFNEDTCSFQRVQNTENKSYPVCSFNYSPTLMSGVSIEIEHFDTQYGLFSSYSVAAAGVGQMSNRSRLTKQCTLAIVGSVRHSTRTRTMDEIKADRERYELDMKIHSQFGFQSRPHQDLDLLRRYYNGTKIRSELNLEHEICGAFNENNFASVIYSNPDCPDTHIPKQMLLQYERLAMAQCILNVSLGGGPGNLHGDEHGNLYEMDDEELKLLDEVSRKRYLFQCSYGKLESVDWVRLLLYIEEDLEELAGWKNITDARLFDVSVVTEDHEVALKKVRMHKALYHCGFVDSEACRCGGSGRGHDDECYCTFDGIVEYLCFAFKIHTTEMTKTVKNRVQTLEHVNKSKDLQKWYGRAYGYAHKKEKAVETPPTFSNLYNLLKDLLVKDLPCVFRGKPKSSDERCKVPGTRQNVSFLGVEHIDWKRLFWMIFWSCRRWGSMNETLPIYATGETCIERLLGAIYEQGKLDQTDMSALAKLTIDEWEAQDASTESRKGKAGIKTLKKEEAGARRKDAKHLIRNYVDEQIWFSKEDD